jgi:CPA1 family monovalent cation:H+ antiporter
LNGFVFILIGLQLPTIIKELEGYSIGEAILYAVIISILTIIIRIIWVFPGAYIPRMLFKSIRDKEPRPTWQTVFLVAWSGMRGVVSLASALAIPLTLNGNAFPHRNLILFITFIVILFTLAVQGLSLKPLIRILNIRVNEKESEKLQAQSLRIHLAESVLAHIDTNYMDDINHDAYKRVRDRYERMIEVAKKKLDQAEDIEQGGAFLPRYRQMLIELVEVRRRELNRVRHSGDYDEELIREREWELDLEEARLRG